MKKIAILILMFAGLLILGCTSAPPATNQTNNSTQAPVPVVKTPSFSITMPLDGDVLTATGDTTNITLTMSTQNLVVKSPGGAAKKGEGYFEVTVDGNEPAVVTGKSYEMDDLTVGTHTVTVKLFNNDRTPYSPSISKEISFSIEAATPAEYVPQSYSVSISGNAFSPANMSVNVGDSVTWTNSDPKPETATCSINGVIMFDTKSIGPGKNATVTFTSR